MGLQVLLRPERAPDEQEEDNSATAWKIRGRFSRFCDAWLYGAACSIIWRASRCCSYLDGYRDLQVSPGHSDRPDEQSCQASSSTCCGVVLGRSLREKCSRAVATIQMGRAFGIPPRARDPIQSRSGSALSRWESCKTAWSTGETKVLSSSGYRRWPNPKSGKIASFTAARWPQM